MKRILDFKAPVDPASAQRLREQLIDFASGLSDAFASVAQTKLSRLRVKARITNAEGVTVAPGESIGIIASVTRVQLAPPSAADSGKFLAICQFPGIAVTTTVYVPAGTLINGVDTYVLPSNGRMYFMFCDGVDYWTDQ